MNEDEGASQSGSYALELLSGTHGTRLFALGAVLQDDKFSLWRYDPTGILRSKTEISFVSKFETAAVIILLLARSTPEELGAMPTSIFKPPSSNPIQYPLTSLSGCSLDVSDPSRAAKNTCITLREHVFSQYALCGRHTMVYKAEAEPRVTDHNIIVKMSFQPKRRTPEQDLVAHGLKYGVEHLPEMHLSGTLWTLQDIGRKAHQKSSNRVSRKKKTDKYEDRQLRIVVYTEYYPITTLFAEHPTAIPIMAEQILSCEY